MRLILLVFLLAVTSITVVHGDENEKENKATAPPNHSIMQSGRGGAYFVPNPLFKRYEALRTQIESLRLAIDNDRPDANSAAEDVRRLQQELIAIEQEIEKAQVFVSALQQFVQTDVYEFDLGEERRVVIVADGVRIESWDGDKIRCELKKSILQKEQPAEEILAKVFVEHSLKVAEDLVGTTTEQRAADSAKFQNSHDAKALTDAQKEARQRVVDDIDSYWQRYAAFQGKPINVLQVKGLTFQEGNEHITISLNSEGGSGSMGGQWRRDADMAVYLPKDVHVVVLGCQTGIDVRNLQGSLMLTADQSHDRDYKGDFSVDGVTGDLTIYGAPIRSIRNVGGSVWIDGLKEMRNGGTHHADGIRKSYVDRSSKTLIQNVRGDVKAVYLDTNLRLEHVRGSIDVINRHGATEMVITDPPAEASHRLISESGRIHVQGPKDVLNAIPWYLFNQVGDVQVNLSQRLLDASSFSSKESWNGYVPVRNDSDSAPLGLFDRLQRPEQILANSERSRGFDVLTRSGRIVLEAVE